MLKNVAIIGGGGYLGRALYAKLSKLGINSWVVVRQLTDLEENSNESLRKCSNPNLEQAIAGATTVVHLASSTTPAIGDSEPFLDLEDIKFTLSLMLACKARNVKQIIFASSGGVVYGDSSEPLSEKSSVNPSGSYGISKIASEFYLKNLASRSDINVTVLRISNPFGGDQMTKRGQGVISFFCNQIFNGENLNLYGNTTRDYIYIDDVINAFYHAILMPKKFEIYNISSGVGTKLVDIPPMISTILGKPCYLTLGQRRPFDLCYNVLINKKAKIELNWEPTYSLFEGLKLYISQNFPRVN